MENTIQDGSFKNRYDKLIAINTFDKFAKKRAKDIDQMRTMVPWTDQQRKTAPSNLWGKPKPKEAKKIKEKIPQHIH